MSRHGAVALTLWTLWTPWAVSLDGQAPVALTLSDALARAEQASYRLAEARARQEGAEAAVLSRRVADHPTLAVSGGYTRTNHVDEFGVPQPDGRLRVIYPDIPDNIYSRITLQWPIYSGGRPDALERAARAEVRATAEDAEVARADLRLEVTRVYWALSTATESVRVLEEALDRAYAHLRDARARFDAGFAPPNEVSSAEAQRARQQLLLIEARNQRLGLVQDLRRLTGIEGDVVAADSLVAPEGDAAAIVLPTGTPRAEQRALTERLQAAGEREHAVAAGRRPTVSVTAAGDYASPNPRIFPRADTWRTSWDVGIAATWTLWDGGRVAAEAAEVLAASKALRARLADVTALIATDVQQRQLDLESARAALVAAEEGVRSAADARRVVDERFNVGVATSTDVLDAQQALLQAELDRTRARANTRLARARLDRALGK
jgi:outer membrane protein TolC